LHHGNNLNISFGRQTDSSFEMALVAVGNRSVRVGVRIAPASRKALVEGAPHASLS
jgi:hypothetical protein